MKTTTPTTNPSAAQAIATWRTAQQRLDAVLTTARRAAVACSNDPSPETRLAKVVAERKALEAEDDERRARAVASWACDARDLAAAEPAAVACSLELLSADLEAEGKEAARLRAELQRLDARAHVRIAAARSGEATLTAARDLAGEPAPRRLPTASGPLETQLAAAIAAGAVPAKNHDGRIKSLRQEETSLRVSLEKAHREKEATKRDREEAKAQKSRDEEARRKREHDAAAAWRAKVAAERAERETLAASHAARQGGA